MKAYYMLGVIKLDNKNDLIAGDFVRVLEGTKDIYELYRRYNNLDWCKCSTVYIKLGEIDSERFNTDQICIVHPDQSMPECWREIAIGRHVLQTPLMFTRSDGSPFKKDSWEQFGSWIVHHIKFSMADTPLKNAPNFEELMNGIKRGKV